MTFPAAWKLTPRESAMLTAIASLDRPVKPDELQAAIAPFKAGAQGRSAKVVLHYLRPKLSGHGIIIRNLRGVGYVLMPDARKKIAAATAEAA